MYRYILTDKQVNLAYVFKAVVYEERTTQQQEPAPTHKARKPEQEKTSLKGKERRKQRWGVTCFVTWGFEVVEAQTQADEPPAGGLCGFGGGSADSKCHVTGEATGTLHKAIKQAG